MTTAAHELHEPSPSGDVWIYRIVVALLGLSILGVVGGSIALRAMGVDVPDSLVAIGTGALGAMAGLLSPLSRS